jgi:hypothetical protein
MDAPHFLHEYFRLPPLAVFSMGSPHSGHAFWSCFMGTLQDEGNGDITPTITNEGRVFDSKRYVRPPPTITITARGDKRIYPQR